jgi:chemotaxis protein MotD
MLTLQLDPPDLGAVIVKMRLIGDAVEVRLTADRYETTQMLQQERGTLTDVMQSAGYAFDIASIDHSRASDANPGAGQQQAQPEQRQSQQMQSGSQIDNAASERQSGDAQAGSRQNRRQHEQFTEPAERNQRQEVVPNRTGGALYL